MLTLPSIPSHIRALSTEDSKRLNAEIPDKYNPKDNCVTCRGRKTFIWYSYAQDPLEIPPFLDQTGEFSCPCQDQYLLYRFMLNSGIGITYQRLSWLDLEKPAPEPILNYLQNLNRYVDAGMGLVLNGNHGNGKSMISMLIAKEAIAKGVDCHFNTFSEMISRFTSGWYDNEAKQWYHQKVKNTTLLVIDELGKEYRPNKVTKEGEQVSDSIAAFLLDEVLRHRLAQALPTIITSNHSLEEIGQRYGKNGSIDSLLTERSISYCFQGADFRVRANERFQNEILLGLTRPIVL